jgi:hypothetical protein
MKKILILSFVVVATLWAETKIEMAVRIENFPENLFFDSDDMDEGDYDACSVFYKGKVRNVYGGIACGDVGLCRTMLDSNILLGWTGGSFAFFDGWGSAIEFYVLTGATHTLREVIEDEFSNYRKCYYITDNDSIFNSMFVKIDSVLVPAINECLQKGNCIHKTLIFDYFRGRMRGVLVPGPNYELGGFAADTVKARNAAISGIAPVRYKLEAIRVQNHRLTASPKLQGRQFTLFDVNGHELRHGTLQNNMQLPTYPTIIKIHGFGTRLLK